MRYAGASDEDWQLFLDDIALFLSTYRRRGLALVWPEGAHALLAGLPGACADGVRPDPPPAPAGDPPDTGWLPARHCHEADRLTAGLDAVLGQEVRLSCRVMPAGTAAEDERMGADCLLLPLGGTVRCRVEGGEDADSPVELWLRPGEVLYVPERCRCVFHVPWRCHLLRVLLRTVS